MRKIIKETCDAIFDHDNKRGTMAKNFQSVWGIMQYATCCWGFRQKTHSDWVSKVIRFIMPQLQRLFQQSFTGFVWREMGKLFEDNYLNLLEGKPLNEIFDLPGEEIFLFKPKLMRPFPGKNADEEQRVYNYRHGRPYRVIENAFGIFAARRRIFQKPIQATVKNVESYTLVYKARHNYLRLTENVHYCPC